MADPTATPPAPPTQPKVTWIDVLKAIPFGVGVGTASNPAQVNAMSWNDITQKARAGIEEKGLWDTYNQLGTMMGYDEVQQIPTLAGKKWFLDNVQTMPIGRKRAEQFFQRDITTPGTPADPGFYPGPGAPDEPSRPPVAATPPSTRRVVPAELVPYMELVSQIPLKDFVTLLGRKDSPMAGALMGGDAALSDHSGEQSYHLRLFPQGSRAQQYLQGINPRTSTAQWRQALNHAYSFLDADQTALVGARKEAFTALRDMASLDPAQRGQAMERVLTLNSPTAIHQFVAQVQGRVPLMSPLEASEKYSKTLEAINDMVNKRQNNQPFNLVLMQKFAPDAGDNPMLKAMLEGRQPLTSPEAQEGAITAAIFHAVQFLVPSLPLATRQGAYDSLDTLYHTLTGKRLPPYQGEGAGVAGAPAASGGQAGTIPGMHLLSKNFLDKVQQVAGRLQMHPEHLLRIMSFETMGTFNPAVKNPHSQATGLIQFLPKTAAGLRTTTDALATMSREQQLDYVERHLAPYAGKMRTLQDAYMAVLQPALVGQPGSTPLFRRGSIEYTQNAGLDIDNNDIITIEEATQKVANYGGRPAPLLTDTATAAPAAAPPAGPGTLTPAQQQQAESDQDVLAAMARAQQAWKDESPSAAQQQAALGLNRQAPQRTPTPAPATPQAGGAPAGKALPPAPTPGQQPGARLMPPPTIAFNAKERVAGLRNLLRRAQASSRSVSPARLQREVQRIMGPGQDVSGIQTVADVQHLLQQLDPQASASPAAAPPPPPAQRAKPARRMTAGEHQSWLRALKIAVQQGRVPAARALQVVMQRLQMTPDQARQALNNGAWSMEHGE